MCTTCEEKFSLSAMNPDHGNIDGLYVDRDGVTIRHVCDPEEDYPEDASWRE
jgi:hypothetical protein